MNIKRQALGGFTRVIDDELLVRGETVLQAIADNPNFPEPLPSIDNFDEHLSDFRETLSAVRRKGSPMDTAAKNASRKVLEGTLKKLAFYVSTVANGDLQILLSSGFEVSGYPRKGGIPTVVQWVVLKEGLQAGQKLLSFNSQKNVLLYAYRYAQEEDENGDFVWSNIFNTTTSQGNFIGGLEPYVQCFVQVRALNGHGTSEWSEPVSNIGK